MDALNKAQVIEIIKTALQVEDEIITVDSSQENVEDWDSMAHLSILAELDKTLDGKAGDIVELAEAISVKLIIETLRENSLIID
jgi:acyl carrier protein